MITSELLELFASPVSCSIGTCSPSLMPNYVRAFGLEGLEGESSVTVFVPKITAEKAIENLKLNLNLALSVANLTNYKARQLKGKLINIREATPAEFEKMKKFRADSAAPLALFFGQNQADTWERSVIWPAWAITMSIDSIYDQTPGKMAGVKLL